MQVADCDTPVYIQALRYLKATKPSAFQIRETGAAEDHPGDLIMWEILSARERSEAKAPHGKPPIREQ